MFWLLQGIMRTQNESRPLRCGMIQMFEEREVCHEIMIEMIKHQIGDHGHLSATARTKVNVCMSRLEGRPRSVQLQHGKCFDNAHPEACCKVYIQGVSVLAIVALYPILSYVHPSTLSFRHKSSFLDFIDNPTCRYSAVHAVQSSSQSKSHSKPNP